MSTYSQIAWLPLCAGLAGLGLVASWFAFRRRGFAAGLRGAAWSLLPLAAYLTGAIEMIWKMGTAIGSFATSFVFSPKVWAGLAVLAVAVVAFVVSGVLRSRRPVKGGDAKRDPATLGTGQKTQALERSSARRPASAAPADDDDFSEIEKILRNRGIS
jgi:hypothetical protein